MKQFRWFILTVIITLNIACNQDPTLYTTIGCENEYEVLNNRTVIDAKNDYQINIGENWKAELYIDNAQSRIYAADTTRSYSESFIIDITRFEGNIKLNEKFQQHLLGQIKSIPRAYVIKESFLKFDENPAYVVYSFQKNDDSVFYNIQYYIAYPDCYFLLESKINGNRNLDKNTFESISIFNSLKQLNKQ